MKSNMNNDFTIWTDYGGLEEKEIEDELTKLSTQIPGDNVDGEE